VFCSPAKLCLVRVDSCLLSDPPPWIRLAPDPVILKEPIRIRKPGLRCGSDPEQDPAKILVKHYPTVVMIRSGDELSEVLGFLSVYTLLRLASVGWPFLRAYLKHRGREAVVGTIVHLDISTKFKRRRKFSIFNPV